MPSVFTFALHVPYMKGAPISKRDPYLNLLQMKLQAVLPMGQYYYHRTNVEYYTPDGRTLYCIQYSLHCTQHNVYVCIQRALSTHITGRGKDHATGRATGRVTGHRKGRTDGPRDGPGDGPLTRDGQLLKLDVAAKLENTASAYI